MAPISARRFSTGCWPDAPNSHMKAERGATWSFIPVHPKIAEVTARIEDRSREVPPRLSRAHRRCPQSRPRPTAPVVRQPRPRVRRRASGRQAQHARPRAEHRHRHQLQRHAERASAFQGLSRPHQGRGAEGRRHGAGCRRHARHVRWRHARPTRHGAVSVLTRRDRIEHRRSPDLTTRSTPA